MVHLIITVSRDAMFGGGEITAVMLFRYVYLSFSKFGCKKKNSICMVILKWDNTYIYSIYNTICTIDSFF